MTFTIIILILGFLFVRNMKDDDSVYRARYNFTSRFIQLYEKDTGIHLTYDQAIALLQVTIAIMAKSPKDKVYLDDRYPKAQSVVDKLCEEAENKVFNKHQKRG